MRCAGSDPRAACEQSPAGLGRATLPADPCRLSRAAPSPSVSFIRGMDVRFDGGVPGVPLCARERRAYRHRVPHTKWRCRPAGAAAWEDAVQRRSPGRRVRSYSVRHQNPLERARDPDGRSGEAAVSSTASALYWRSLQEAVAGVIEGGNAHTEQMGTEPAPTHECLHWA